MSIRENQSGLRRTAGKSSAWMLGRTPPWEMTTWPSNRLSSSSFRIASCKCRGMIRDFLLSRAAFPASSRISAERYLITRVSIRERNHENGDWLENGGEVDRGSSSYTLSVVSLSEQSVNTSNGELQSSLGGSRHWLFVGISSSFSSWFTSGWHLVSL